MLNPDFLLPAIPSTSPKAIKRLQRKETKDAKRSKVLEARTPRQADLIRLLNTCGVVFAVGPAGTGKTYVASVHAAQRLEAGIIDRIVMTRPTISQSRHRMGFLPGTGDQKMAPWMIPIMDALRDSISPQQMEKYKNEKRIEILPFEQMRGRTIKNGVFILDEAQNCTFSDLAMFITRVGEGATVIICGDLDPIQNDLGDESGLATFVDIAETQQLNAGIVRFTEDDVVRSEIAAEWVKALAKHRQTNGIGMLR